MVKVSCLYTADVIQNKCTENSYAQLCNGQYIKIRAFVVTNDKLGKVFYNRIKTIQLKYYNFIHVVEEIEVAISVTSTNYIKKIYVFVSNNEKNDICTMSNMLHY